MELTFWQQLLQRLKSENPEFYDKLMKIVIRILIVDAIFYVFLWFNVFFTPVWHTKLTGGCVSLFLFLGGAFLVSATGTKDPKLISNDTKAAIVKDAVEDNK